jgi:hypothetical protein
LLRWVNFRYRGTEHEGGADRVYREIADALEGRRGHCYFSAMMDLNAFREALQTALLDAASAETGRPWRAVALGNLYAETDGVIYAPILYLNTDGENMDSPPRLGDFPRRLGTRLLDRGADR